MYVQEHVVRDIVHIHVHIILHVYTVHTNTNVHEVILTLLRDTSCACRPSHLC